MDNLEEMARQSMAQFLPGATPPAAPPAAQPQATTPVAVQATATTPGFDPTTGAVVKAPAHKAGILGNFEELKEKFEILGPIGLLAWEAFQAWRARANDKLDEVQQDQIDAQARVDKRHDELIEAQERLNANQQAEIETLKKAVLAQQRQINSLLGTPPAAAPAPEIDPFGTPEEIDPFA